MAYRSCGLNGEHMRRLHFGVTNSLIVISVRIGKPPGGSVVLDVRRQYVQKFLNFLLPLNDGRMHLARCDPCCERHTAVRRLTPSYAEEGPRKPRAFLVHNRNSVYQGAAKLHDQEIFPFRLPAFRSRREPTRHPATTGPGVCAILRDRDILLQPSLPLPLCPLPKARSLRFRTCKEIDFSKISTNRQP